MTPTKKRIGVLTGGGDCPGLNAVIRAVVKTAIYQHDYEVIGIRDGYSGLVNGNSKSITDADVGNIITQGGTILGTSNRDNPFKYRKDAKSEPADRSGYAMMNYENWNLDALICIGGDGSLSLAKQFGDKGMNVVGVPKTIDNDLNATDYTFGHDSAVFNATEAIDKARDTAQSHHRIIVIETMGRYAGWIALRSGVASGASVVLIPEIPYQTAKIAEFIAARAKEGKRFSIVVVAEGARAAGGDYVSYRTVKGSHDPIRLGGVSHQIANALEDATEIEARSMILGYIQRGGTPSPFDRILSTRFGVHAVELVAQKKFGHMVALKGDDIVSAPLEEAVGQLKKVDPQDKLIQAARSVGTCFGD